MSNHCHNLKNNSCFEGNLLNVKNLNSDNSCSIKMHKAVLNTLSYAALSCHSRFASNISRQSNMLKKLMTGKKRPKFHENVDLSTKPKLLIQGNATPTKIVSRRVIVLNKLMMGHVSDLIANGSVENEIQGVGLVITKVQVCQNYHGLKVYWTSNTSTEYDSIAQKLERIKKPLRHHLCQMQLMGNIPHITFVRDKEMSYFEELDHLLSIADYGEDHELNDPKPQLESDFEPGQNSKNLASSSLPPMRHDVFGLDHSLIMGRIKQNIAKSKQAWKAYEENKLRSNLVPSKPFIFTTSFESIREESQDKKRSEDILQQFLLKRKETRKMKRKNRAVMESFDGGWNEEEENPYDWTKDQDEEIGTYEEF